MQAASTCRWLVNRTNTDYVEYVARSASVSLPLAQVMINRGLKTADHIHAFLNPSIEKLSDPFDLPDMQKAVGRIRQARQRHERILVCGDYDADGVSATAILMEAFRMLGIDADFFIPHRIEHGYGFGPAGIERAKAVGASLIITVDCGISAFDTVDAARSAGIDVVITDHHEAVPAATDHGSWYRLPAAAAVVNPKLLPDDLQLKGLCGAGVAFKIAQALFDNRIGDVAHLFDLAAIGTSADVVPLVGDNRIFVREGLNLIRSNQRPGIQALREAAGLKPDYFKPSFLPYILIPRINAAGRVDDASCVVQLLMTTDRSEAAELAQRLQALNQKRQEIEESVMAQAMEQLAIREDDCGPIVLAGDGWHPGVLGIVASRLADQYYRPVLVFSVEDGMAKGSARSIPAFNIHHALGECADLLARFGGHRQAAGLGLAADRLGALQARLAGIMAETLTQDDFVRVIEIDAAVRISDITFPLIDELSRMEPFGFGNAEPLFGCRNLEPSKARIVGNKHLKMYLRQNGRGIDSIGFDFGPYLEMVESASRIDAAFLPVLNEWEGGRSVQLNLRAIRPSSIT